VGLRDWTHVERAACSVQCAVQCAVGVRIVWCVGMCIVISGVSRVGPFGMRDGCSGKSEGLLDRFEASVIRGPAVNASVESASEAVPCSTLQVVLHFDSLSGGQR